MSSSFHIDKFNVHTRTEIESVVNKDNKVCVVSIIGKSRLIPSDCKASCFNSFLKTDAFKGFTDPNWHTLDNTVNIQKIGKLRCRLDGYYDTQAGIIFLNLLSTWDTSLLASITKQVQEDRQQDFSSVWKSSEYSHMRALLFIFSVSHIVIIANPGTSFDISYIRLLKTLDSVRLKIQPLISESLKRLPISKDWIVACRPCSPRVLFVFEYPALDSYLTESDSKSHGNPSPVKELQHAIEDQVYRILRKSRIITNTSNNSLFAVPQNQEFVYIHPMQSSSTRDLVNFYMMRLKTSCSAPTERVSSRSKSYQLNRKTRTESSDDREKVSSASRDVECRSPSSESSSFGSVSSDDEGFSGFLSQHINLALTKGFDDNVGRNPVQAVFELPSLSAWFSVVNKLHGIYWSDDTVDAKIQTQFTAMKSLMDIDMRFSDGHCRKVLPLAEAAYSEGLPPTYTLAYHTTKLQEAVNVFLHHARGPACEKYIAQLKEDCMRIWQDGRQMCEEISLTGNHCVSELHRLPDMPDMESTKHLPVMPHSSQIKTKCACNCGQRIGEREDPFEHRMANYDFYQRLEQQCCAKLEHFEMSVFKPSTTEVRPAEVAVQTSTAFVDEPESPTVVRKDSSKFDLAFGMSGGSFALSLGQSGCSDFFMHDTESQNSPEDEESPPEDEGEDDDEAGSMTTTNEDIDEDEVEARVKDIEAITLMGQHSTTEYLPGMLHTDSLPGLLPKFPSWSLVLLGKYSSYNPAQGVDQPGFLLPSNFLLPLDLQTESTKSILGNDMPGKKGKIKKPVKDVVQVVRLYIGMEYECSRGHRFFLSSPDRIFKAPPTGLFKETGHKVVNHDMPLYFSCSCRQGQVMGQLMRVHLVIPEGGVEVKLRPKVQPAPAPCPFFFPEASECLILRSGVWVLRLPFIYMGDTGPYRMPTDPQLQSACRFVKGFLSVAEST